MDHGPGRGHRSRERSGCPGAHVGVRSRGAAPGAGTRRPLGGRGPGAPARAGSAAAGPLWPALPRSLPAGVARSRARGSRGGPPGRRGGGLVPWAARRGTARSRVRAGRSPRAQPARPAHPVHDRRGRRAVRPGGRDSRPGHPRVGRERIGHLCHRRGVRTGGGRSAGPRCRRRR